MIQISYIYIFGFISEKIVTMPFYFASSVKWVKFSIKKNWVGEWDKKQIEDIKISN